MATHYSDEDKAMLRKIMALLQQMSADLNRHTLLVQQATVSSPKTQIGDAASQIADLSSRVERQERQLEALSYRPPGRRRPHLFYGDQVIEPYRAWGTRS